MTRRPLLKRVARDAVRCYENRRKAKERLEELVVISRKFSSCEIQETINNLRRRVGEHDREMESFEKEVRLLGGILKDPRQGLVYFYSQVAEGDSPKSEAESGPLGQADLSELSQSDLAPRDVSQTERSSRKAVSRRRASRQGATRASESVVDGDDVDNGDVDNGDVDNGAVDGAEIGSRAANDSIMDARDEPLGNQRRIFLVWDVRNPDGISWHELDESFADRSPVELPAGATANFPDSSR